MRAPYWEDFACSCSQHISHIIKVFGGIPLGSIQVGGGGETCVHLQLQCNDREIAHSGHAHAKKCKSCNKPAFKLQQVY